MKIKNQRVNALTADQGTSGSTSSPIRRWNTWRCHKKNKKTLVLISTPVKHYSLRTGVSTREITWRERQSTKQRQQEFCAPQQLRPPLGASSREQDPGFMGQKMFTSFNYQSQQRGGSLTKARDCGGEIQIFRRVRTATLGEESEREQQQQQQEGTEWFLQDLTVCFSVWCIKSC